MAIGNPPQFDHMHFLLLISFFTNSAEAEVRSKFGYLLTLKHAFLVSFCISANKYKAKIDRYLHPFCRIVLCKFEEARKL